MFDLSDFLDKEPSNRQQSLFPIDPKDIVESRLEFEHYKNFNSYKRKFKLLWTKKLQSLYKDNYISGAVIDGYMMSEKITGDWRDDIYFLNKHWCLLTLDTRTKVMNHYDLFLPVKLKRKRKYFFFKYLRDCVSSNNENNITTINNFSFEI